MLARSLGRAASSAGFRARGGARACASIFVEARFASSSSVSNSPLSLRCFAVSLPQQRIGVRHRSSSRPPLDGEGNEDELVDVTPVGDKPWQITAEAIREAEAAEPLKEDDLEQDEIEAGNPSDWEFDASTEELVPGGEMEGDENPPTPILDAYERSRDPDEMERLIQLSFDSLPERAGPQRYNHKRREHQRYRTIRNIKYKEKAQRMAAHERKLQKRRDRKARELALFATWRGTDGSAVADAKQLDTSN